MPKNINGMNGNKDTTNFMVIDNWGTNNQYTQITQNNTNTTMAQELFLRGHIGDTSYLFATNVRGKGSVYHYYSGHSKTLLSETKTNGGGWGNDMWGLTSNAYYSFRPVLIVIEV